MELTIAEGKRGTIQTLQMMAKLAIAGSKDLDIRDTATELVQGLDQKDFFGETCVLTEFVRDKIRYVRDIRDVETIHYAPTILNKARGDCDDKAILLSALLLSIGHHPRFVAAAIRPDEYFHVWVQDLLNGNWLDLETTEPIQCGDRVPLPPGARLLTFEIE